MSPEELPFVAELARRRAGLHVRPDRAHLAEARLAPVARRQGFADVPALISAAREDEDGEAATALVEALASSDTAFFRDRQMFERLAGDTLPALARRRPDGVVRVWSIGCGAGQEVYSLAIAAAEAATPELKLQLFASDLSDRALQKARAGAYTHFEVQRGLPVRTLLRWFEKTGEAWRVQPQLRQGVRWARVNLMDDLSRLGVFDVILCRNVLGGLDVDAARESLLKLEALLAPDGVLVMGASEAPELPASLHGQGGIFHRDPQAVREAA